MLHILNNLDLYEDQLHILPGELRDRGNKQFEKQLNLFLQMGNK